MTEASTQQAEAYIKLHEDVKKLIVQTVIAELKQNPYGEMSTYLRHLCTDASRAIIDREINNYRVVYRGTTASY